jgi:A/G-specific adenine glycosylase
MTSGPSSRRRFRHEVLAWFEANARDFPWRHTRDPFLVLVAEVLLQQTLAYKVPSVFDQLAARYGTADAMANAPVNELEDIIRPLGLVKRAAGLQRLAGVIVERHEGFVPKDSGDLAALPGVGPYTTSAVRCFAFGAREAIVDTNVVRIITRYFGGDSHDTALAAVFARQCLPGTEVERWNWALLDYSAVLCKTTSPRCSLCPLGGTCQGRTLAEPLRRGRGLVVA